MAASNVVSILCVLLRRHEVNDLLLLYNRNSILNKTIENKRIKWTTTVVILIEFIFLHEETRTHVMIQHTLWINYLAEVCCVCFPRINGKPNVLIRLFIERFTHEGI